MKKLVFLGLMGLTLNACTASHQSGTKSQVDQEQVAKATHLATQGGAEDQWSRRVFQEHYQYLPHTPYQGAVQLRNTRQVHVFGYGRDTLRVVDVHDDYLPLFTSGILFPTVHAGDYLPRISNIQELRQATGFKQRRRFTMYVWSRLTANPTLYVFELTNQRATPETDLPSFLQGAVLTFIREVGGLM